MASKKKAVGKSYLKQISETKKTKAEPQETPKAKADTPITNLIDELYFGISEKTVSDSPYNTLSQTKPYNPDDLFQKTNDYSIYEEMLQDEQVNVCMNIKKDLVIGSGWDIHCKETEGLHKQIKEDLERAFTEDTEIPFEDQLQEIVSAFEFGFSLSEKVFKHRDDGSLTLKFMKTRHPSTWLIHTDKYGNVEKYEQRGADHSLKIDTKSLVHFVNNPKFQNPYGTSDLRAAYNAWFVKRQIVRFYGIFMEKAASPTAVATYKASANKEAVDDIYAAIKKLQTKTALAIPDVVKVEFMEAKNNGDVFIKGLNMFNMFIGRALMIPDLLGFQGGETAGGSYALGKDQIAILFKHIGRRRTSLERIVNKHFVEPFIVYNYGFVENAPKFKLRPISDELLIDLAKIWLEAVKGKVWKPNEEEVNHFRALAKFPEGDVIEDQQAQDSLGNAEELNKGNNNGKETKQKGIQGRQKEGDQEDLPNADDKKQKQDKLSQRQRSLNSDADPEGEPRAYKVYDLPSGQYHRKVNFSAIEKKMDDYKQSIHDETLPVIKNIFQDLFNQIESKRIIKDVKVDRMDSLKPKYLSQLKTILQKNLRGAYSDSKAGAQKELLKGNYRTPLANDKFLEVLEADIYNYIGDWAYNLTKQAKIAIMEAINDGKPLSAVIDTLEADAEASSDVSIERYARTKLTEVMNRGRVEFFNESGVVAAYQYSAVLDDRTTEICSSLHSKIFRAGEEPVPPLHWNCRSILVPITKYEEWDADEKVGKQPIQEFITENKGDGFSKN